MLIDRLGDQANHALEARIMRFVTRPWKPNGSLGFVLEGAVMNLVTHDRLKATAIRKGKRNPLNPYVAQFACVDQFHLASNCKPGKARFAGFLSVLDAFAAPDIISGSWLVCAKPKELNKSHFEQVGYYLLRVMNSPEGKALGRIESVKEDGGD